MIRVRGGRGLGDALYIRPVAEHFVRAGRKVTVCSDYSDVFIGSGAEVARFERTGCNVVAHYTHGKNKTDTNQWQDVCTSAGVPGLDLRFKWEVQNDSLVRDLAASACGRPILMVNGGRPPMGRADGFAAEMLPRREAFEALLGGLRDCFIVEVGQGPELYPLKADIDLSDRTSPADLLDIATVASGLIGQCSFMIPLAEAFDKPLVVVWAARGLQSREQFIKQCTPQKILSKASSRWIMDDWAPEKIAEAAHAFRVVL